jgi:hypothetical protein
MNKCGLISGLFIRVTIELSFSRTFESLDSHLLTCSFDTAELSIVRQLWSKEAFLKSNIIHLETQFFLC